MLTFEIQRRMQFFVECLYFETLLISKENYIVQGMLMQGFLLYLLFDVRYQNKASSLQDLIPVLSCGLCSLSASAS